MVSADGARDQQFVAFSKVTSILHPLLLVIKRVLAADTQLGSKSVDIFATRHITVKGSVRCKRSSSDGGAAAASLERHVGGGAAAASLEGHVDSMFCCCCCSAAGGPEGVKSVASQLITQHQLDDTFYVVDLANVVRLFKVWECVYSVSGGPAHFW
jgi:hypothetical protein